MSVGLWVEERRYTNKHLFKVLRINVFLIDVVRLGLDTGALPNGTACQMRDELRSLTVFFSGGNSVVEVAGLPVLIQLSNRLDSRF